MAEDSHEGVKHVAEKARGAAMGTTERGGEAIERMTATALQGYEQVLALGRDHAEAVAETTTALLGDMQRIGGEWIELADEQISGGMDALQSFARCRSWSEALEVQSRFTRLSLERFSSRTARITELAARMAGEDLRPLQESARRAAERVAGVLTFPRHRA